MGATPTSIPSSSLRHRGAATHLTSARRSSAAHLSTSSRRPTPPTAYGASALTLTSPSRPRTAHPLFAAVRIPPRAHVTLPRHTRSFVAVRSPPHPRRTRLRPSTATHRRRRSLPIKTHTVGHFPSKRKPWVYSISWWVCITAPFSPISALTFGGKPLHSRRRSAPLVRSFSPSIRFLPSSSTMASSPDILSPKSSPTEDWTIVLPRRGKKSRAVNKFVIPKRQKEVQVWTPIDLETDPDRESKLMQKLQISIQKLANSEFHRSFLDQIQNSDMLDKFRKVLGSEEKMQMVFYGIGSIESFEPPRLQLSLAIFMKRSFDWVGEIQVFDPIISLTESKVLTSLGCTVLSVNEQGRRQALNPTLFFMPHCEAELYDNLLEANWGVDKLSRLIIFGNSFGEYDQHVSLCKSSAVANSRKHVLAARSFTEEFRINSLSDDYFRAFNGSSWHFFSLDTAAHLPIIDYNKFEDKL